MGGALALAFAAGLVATANPCGIAMLPAYLSWLVGDGADGRRSLRDALLVGVVMAAGVVGVLVLVGVAISLGLRVLISVVPWLAIAIGLGLIVLGWRTLTGRSVPGFGVNTKGPEDRSLRSVAVFGVSYAVASLSCTMPVFLAVIAGSSVQAGILGSIGVVVAYGLGMSLLLIVLTAAVSIGREGLVRRVRASAKWLETISGVVAIGAGVILVWFWVVNLSQGRGAGTTSGVFPFIEQASAALSNWFASAATEIGLALAAIIAVLVAIAVVHSRRSSASDDDAEDSETDSESASI